MLFDSGQTDRRGESRTTNFGDATHCRGGLQVRGTLAPCLQGVLGVRTCANISVEGLACHARGSHPWVRLNNGTTGEFE